jgi:APA family basic amino acid/polyamine antiporter
MNFRKSIDLLTQEAQQSGEGTLKRTLGPTSLVALGIGAIIGAGLFSITGSAAANNAGPAITILQEVP